MDKYVKVRKIGQGSFGSAYLATRKADPQKQQYVIKEIVLDPRDQANAQREARLLAALDHPNIIACKESFMLKSSTPSPVFLGHHLSPTVLCIVTEFADGGDLSQEIARRTPRRAYFEPDELLGYFVQVCLALKHLHDRKILHRDIKPANIFLTKSGVVKVGDLGVATVLSHTLACAQTSTGTPYYTAPEICLGKRYNAKADVWSLGCMLFEMISFTHPFDGRSQRQLFENIVHGVTPQLPACGGLSCIRRELQSMVDEMLRKEPRARPSVNQLIRRDLVLDRIHTFLSAQALHSELNHTVLHGENVFRKKTIVEDKVLSAPPLAQHVRQAEPVRHAEPVARSPAIIAAVKPSPSLRQQNLRKTPPPRKARVGSLLGASRKARGLSPGPFRRSRPIQKHAPADRVSSRVAAAGGVKQRVAPAKAKRAAPSAAASAQLKAKLRAQIKEREAAAAAVAALPDPPKIKSDAKAFGGISERVAAFNAQWAAQKEQLVKNLPPPPSKSKATKSVAVSKTPTQYPRPVVVGVKGQGPRANNRAPPPAPVSIRRQPSKQKTPLSAPKPRGSAVRDSQPSLREHRLEFQRKKQSEVDGKPKASPLDDPIILVQQLPDFKIEPPPVAVQPPPAPTSLDLTTSSSLPEFADKNAGSTTNSGESEESHEQTVLPPMANLEFERMVLQLKSAVEAASDDEDDDEDDNSDETFDPNSSPPPYSTNPITPSPSFSLDIKVLEDPTFRLALQKRLQQHKSTGNEQKSENGVDQFDGGLTQQATLTWMHTYITSLL